MAKLILGALVASMVACVAWTVAGRSEAFAQRPGPPPAVGSDLVVLPIASDKGQMLVMVDPRQQSLAVYRIDPANGKISLRSARSFRWDLQMRYLNNESPLPDEIRGLLEQR